MITPREVRYAKACRESFAAFLSARGADPDEECGPDTILGTRMGTRVYISSMGAPDSDQTWSLSGNLKHIVAAQEILDIDELLTVTDVMPTPSDTGNEVRERLDLPEDMTGIILFEKWIKSHTRGWDWHGLVLPYRSVRGVTHWYPASTWSGFASLQEIIERDNDSAISMVRAIMGTISSDIQEQIGEKTRPIVSERVLSGAINSPEEIEWWNEAYDDVARIYALGATVGWSDYQGVVAYPEFHRRTDIRTECVEELQRVYAEHHGGESPQVFSVRDPLGDHSIEALEDLEQARIAGAIARSRSLED